MLRSNLCDHSDTYIVVKGTTTVKGNNASNREDKKLTFKNSATFKSCLSKISNTLIENAEDLDIVTPVYNCLEYSYNYSMTSGSLRNCYRDEMNDDANENNIDNYRTINNKTITSKSFEYKAKIIGSIPDDNNALDTEVVVPLKYLSNFCRYDSARDSFDKYYMPLAKFKDFNALIDSKPFFDQPVKNKQAYEKLVKVPINNDYTTGKLLDKHITKIVINSLVLIYQDKYKYSSTN